MNTAITISGMGRSIEYTIDNIKENLIDQFPDADVFVYIAKNAKSDLAVELFSKLNNVHINLVEEVDLDISKLVFMPGWLENHRHKDGTRPTRQGITRMFNARAVLSDMVSEAEITKNKKYNRVINSRDDVHYLKPLGPLIEPLDMSKLWIPHFHHWLGGYCDRFAVANKHNMDLYLQMVRYFDDYCAKGHIIHSETTHKFHLDRTVGQSNVKTFHCEVNRVRSDGSLHPEGFPNPAEVRWQ